MTDNKNLTIVEQFKEQLNAPKTYEQFVLEQSLTEQQDLYPDLVHEDISSSRGYGPGDDKKYNQHLISTFNRASGGSLASVETSDSVSTYDNKKGYKINEIASSAGAEFGVGGAIASGKTGYSAFRYSDENGDIKFGNASTGGEVGAGWGGATAKVEANASLVDFKSKGVHARFGVSGDTGATVGPGGAEVSVAGLGVSIGKKTGIKTPLGDVSVDFEEACKQQ